MRKKLGRDEEFVNKNTDLFGSVARRQFGQFHKFGMCGFGPRNVGAKYHQKHKQVKQDKHSRNVEQRQDFLIVPLEHFPPKIGFAKRNQAQACEKNEHCDGLCNQEKSENFCRVQYQGSHRVLWFSVTMNFYQSDGFLE